MDYESHHEAACGLCVCSSQVHVCVCVCVCVSVCQCVVYSDIHMCEWYVHCACTTVSTCTYIVCISTQCHNSTIEVVHTRVKVILNLEFKSSHVTVLIVCPMISTTCLIIYVLQYHHLRFGASACRTKEDDERHTHRQLATIIFHRIH